MNLVTQAATAARAELEAWEQDPLRYLPRLREFVMTHGLADLIELARQEAVVVDPLAVGRPPGYPWQHGLRVAAGALALAEAEGLTEVDRVGLFVAALYHDLAHGGADDDHQRLGAELAARCLAGRLPAEQLDRVTRWIAASDRLGDHQEPEQQLLWDANALDLHGAMFIVRGISFAAVSGLPPEVAVAVFEQVVATHRAWIERVHFAATRQAMARRVAAETRFLDDLRFELG